MLTIATSAKLIFLRRMYFLQVEAQSDNGGCIHSEANSLTIDTDILFFFISR